MERTAVQYTENPEEPLDIQAEYMTWVPGHPTGASSLNSVIAGHAYLIFATNAFTQVITGRPAVPRIEWIPSTNAVNLVGFSQDGAATFGNYLAGAEFDTAKLSIYAIGGTNRASPTLFSVTGFGGLSTVPIMPGKAYGIACNKVSTFSGPIKVFPAGTSGISFSADSSSQTLRLKNENGAPLTVTLFATNSVVSSGVMPLLPTLFYFDYLKGWLSLTSTNVQKTLQTGEEWTLPLSIDRTAMIKGQAYGGVLVCSDSAGGQVKIPLDAQYGEPDPAMALWPAGLWVGKARLNQVSQVLDDGTTLNDAAAGSPMELRLILHVDTTGRCRLLQRVLVAGAEDSIGNWNPALYVKESAVPAGLKSVRISTVAFGLNNDILWDESAGDFGSTLKFTYTIGADDPVNPFRHPYHPDHDGLGYDFQTKLPSGDDPQNYIGEIKPETFSISNTVSLVWDDESMMAGGSAFWNPSESVSGDIQFLVEGVRKEGAILMQGRFDLRRVSQVGTLTEE